MRDEPTRNRIHPQKFALLAACASIVMMFAAFTSSFIVRQAAGNWLEFKLPDIFFYNTIVIVASSLALHGAYIAFKRGSEAGYKGLLAITFVLGLVFLIFQYQGWLEMEAQGVYLDGNASGSFIYIISAVHAAHLLGGIATIIMAMLYAFKLPYKVTERRKLRFELVLWYWHFVGALWLYLIVFLSYMS